MSGAAGDPGIVYILHLDPPYRHARHYTGHAEPGHLAERLAEHGTARGARLLQVQREAGGSWHVARTLPGGRDLERAIKDAQAVPRYCPDCTPAPRQSPPDVTPRRQRIAARAATLADPVPAVPRPRLPAPPPAEQGRRSGERFLATRQGWSADRLAAVLKYVTGPSGSTARATRPPPSRWPDSSQPSPLASRPSGLPNGHSPRPPRTRKEPRQ